MLQIHGAGQTLSPLEIGFCQSTEILMYRHQQCGAFAALEKRAKCAAAGSSEVLQEEEEAVVSKHV